MPKAAAQLLAGGDVPQPHRAVPTRRGDRLAIRREGEGADLIVMAGAYMALFTGCDIPEPERAVVAAGGERAVIRGERNRGDVCGVARQLSRALFAVGGGQAHEGF